MRSNLIGGNKSMSIRHRLEVLGRLYRLEDNCMDAIDYLISVACKEAKGEIKAEEYPKERPPKSGRSGVRCYACGCSTMHVHDFEGGYVCAGCHQTGEYPERYAKIRVPLRRCFRTIAYVIVSLLLISYGHSIWFKLHGDVCLPI